MKYIWVFFAVLLMLTQSLPGQPSITDMEVNEISNQLVTRLNNKEFAGTLVVFDFTDQSGTPTSLGALIAKQIRSNLVNANGKFNIVALEPMPDSRNSSSLLNQIAQTASQDAHEFLQRDEANIAQAAGKGLEIFSRPSKKDKRLKKVDAIVDGNITPMGDYYRLNIEVKNRKNGHFIATVQGNISNIDAVAQLHETSLNEPTPGTPSAVSTNRPINPKSRVPNNFKKQHLTFELIGCSAGVRYLECDLRIISEDRDTEIYIYRNGTKIFNQEGGTEYIPVSVKIADLTSNNSVKKNLIRDVSVTSTITFDPGESIEVLSRFQLNCWVRGLGYFTADMSDIFVE